MKDNNISIIAIDSWNNNNNMGDTTTNIFMSDDLQQAKEYVLQHLSLLSGNIIYNLLNKYAYIIYDIYSLYVYMY